MTISGDSVLALVPVVPQASSAAEANSPAPGGEKKPFSQRLVGQYQTGQVGHPVSLRWNGSTEQ